MPVFKELLWLVGTDEEKRFVTLCQALRVHKASSVGHFTGFSAQENRRLLWLVWKCPGRRHGETRPIFAQVWEIQAGGRERQSRWHGTTADTHSLCEPFSCLQPPKQWTFPSPLLLYSPSFPNTIVYRTNLTKYWYFTGSFTGSFEGQHCFFNRTCFTINI